MLLIIPLLLLVSGRATSAREALAEPDMPLNQADVTALSKGFLTGPNDGEALEIARRYLEENKDALGLTNADLADLIVTDQYVSQHNGVTHIYLRQRFNEIEVFGGNININIAADGSVINVGDRFVRCDVLSSPPNTNQGCVASDSMARQPSLSAIEAVESAAEHLGLSVNQSLTVQRRRPGSAQEVLLSDGGISQDSIPVKLVYQPVEGRDELRLAWDVAIHLQNGQNWWNLRVDALTGEVLEQQDWIVNDNWQIDEHGEGVARQEEAGKHVPASPRLSKPNPEHLPNPEHSGSASGQYRVFPFPYVSPEDPGVTHTLVTEPADAIASPFGWHDTDGVAGAEFTDTRGNNVFAQDDVDGSNGKGFRPDGGVDLLFDFAVDPTFQPSGSTNLEAAIVNLFYWSNISHDIFYHYGFDEVSGNFQQNNYGKGGQENDALQADAQDRSGINNANFAVPPDGEMPRMQMFSWTFSNPNRDSALENSVIVHEYGHGVSTRLTGGPSNVSCLFNNEQMGEGWSDWLGLALTAKATDKASASLEPHGMAPYLLGQPPDGRGIRSFPYSTDMTINPQTYDTIKKAVSVHKVGEVWAGMLWEVYWALVDKHSFNPNLYHDWNTGGNNLAIQLVMDGMKLQPCEPGFVDGRDAILQADMLLTGGANQCPIWHAFAKRGLGVSADQGHSHDLSDGSEAFDLPPACQFLEVTPVTQDICVGERADYQVRVGPGYSSPVSMSASGTPLGTSFDFTPNAPLTPPSSATLSIANTERAEAGNYTVTITGTGSDISSDMTVELNVFDGVPGSVTLTEPSDHATNVSRNRTFSWIAATQGVTYTIEVDDNPAFSSIDYRATVSDTTHTAISSFNPKQTYYWRVQATNHCGTGPHLSSGSFTTKEVSPILVVDDDHNTPDVRPYYMDILEGLGYNIDIWDTTQSNNHELDASFLAPYEMVIWFSGDFSGDSADDLAGPSQADETALGSYLDRGADHCLFLTSQTYHQDRGLTRFMQSHLGVDSILENQSYTTVTGSGSVFGQLGPHALSFPQNNYSDVLLPNESADVAFSSDKGSAAIYKENGDSRALFFGFPFESIATNSERKEVMQSIIEWCGLNEDIALLTGRVTDADSGRPIQGATVTANNGRSQRSATTNYTGHYTMSLTVDQYDLTVSALNYQQQVISIDTPLHDRTSRQDFVLQGSSLTYDSLSLEESLKIGEVVTNTITITNSGPLPIDYKVTVGGNYRYFMPLVMAGPNTTSSHDKTSSNDGTSSNDFSRSTSSNDFSRSDDFGYTIIDSNESSLEGPGPMYKFVNIKESGTRVALDENESDGPFPMGFDFNFYGTSQNEFYISSNGFISFDRDSDSLSNQCLLPHSRAPSNLIALMWDDLDPQFTQDYVYYQSFTSCPYGSGACLIVQYDKYHYFPGIASSTSTFEAILFERGDILIQYAQVGHKKGAGSTTGIENADGTIGLTYGTCDTPNHLADRLAICFAHPEGNACDSGVRNWAKVAAESGTIPPNSSTTLDVIFDSTAQFQTDDLNAYLWFSGHFVNDPDPLPLTMSLSCPTCGLLNGFITDADNDEWLSGGIEVTGPDDFNVIINSHNYNMEVEPGTYNFTVNANGYLSQTATMTATSGLTVTTDFPLIANVAKLNFSPLSIDKSLSMGDLVTHTMTITNSGVAELTLEVNLDHFEGPRLEKGLTSATESPWLSGDEDDESERLRSQSQLNANSGETKCISANSQTLKGVEVATNRGTQLVYPSTYRWAGNDNTFNILLYADDSIHEPPYSLPDQALQAKGFAYTAIYHDWEEFETCLTTETWDLVLVANDQGIPPRSTLTALNDYVTEGGKLIFHGWTVRDRRDHPLWQTLGFTWKSNVRELDPVYWWQTKHPIFTNPKSVPELTDLKNVNYRIYGQRVEPLPGALPLAGYTLDPNANEAALILANDGRTVFKGFLDVQNSADLDEDGILDGVELWINLIVGIQTGFDASAQWPRMIPDSATIAPNSSATFDLVFDASSLYEVGDYSAELGFSGNFVNDPGTIPLSMEVTCPTCGLLNGSITAGNTANPLPANIHVTGPNDFDVTITGDSYNLTLLPGRYELSVESSGYFTKTASVKISEGMTTTTDLALLAKRILLPLVSK
ncbi:MAG: M36 family metallopeptidase [Ardenticatenaceae bacterium]